MKLYSSVIYYTHTLVESSKLTEIIVINYFECGTLNLDFIPEQFFESNTKSKLKKFAGSFSRLNLNEKQDLRTELPKLFYKRDKIELLFLGYFNHYSIPLQEGLLRFLEEPPENLIPIIFASDKSLVLETIASRCQSFFLPKKMVLKCLDKSLNQNVKKKLPDIKTTLKQLFLNQEIQLPTTFNPEREEIDYWLWQMQCYLEEFFKKTTNPHIANLIRKVCQSRMYNRSGVQKKLVLKNLVI